MWQIQFTTVPLTLGETLVFLSQLTLQLTLQLTCGIMLKRQGRTGNCHNSFLLRYPSD